MMTDRTSRALLAGALGVGLFAALSPNTGAESGPAPVTAEHAPQLPESGAKADAAEVSGAAPTALSPAPSDVTMVPAGVPFDGSGGMDAEATLLLGMIAGIVLAGVGMFGIVPTPARSRTRRIPL
ncbi:MAG: hypothetical protein ACT4P1_03010 [Sporichthyaceae bacterium]